MKVTNKCATELRAKARSLSFVCTADVDDLLDDREELLTALKEAAIIIDNDAPVARTGGFDAAAESMTAWAKRTRALQGVSINGAPTHVIDIQFDHDWARLLWEDGGMFAICSTFGNWSYRFGSPQITMTEFLASVGADYLFDKMVHQFQGRPTRHQSAQLTGFFKKMWPELARELATLAVKEQALRERAKRERDAQRAEPPKDPALS